MKTLHVIGYKNSGKTTLIVHWVNVLRGLGLEVAVLKHHGHGGAPELPPAHTDTMQYLEAGAVTTVVAGGGMVELIQQKECSFHQLKALAAVSCPEVLLIEGYKQEVGEKVVLFRGEEDRLALASLPGVIQTACTGALFSNQTMLDAWLKQWVLEA